MDAECPYCNQSLVLSKSWPRFLQWFRVGFGECINENCDGYKNQFARSKDGDVYGIPSSEGIKLIPFRMKEFGKEIIG